MYTITSKMSDDAHSDAAEYVIKLTLQRFRREGFLGKSASTTIGK